MDLPITTLFLLTSVDGKISTGASNALDVDRDYPNIVGVKEGLHQYYEIEKTTDLCSLNTGKVMSKIGVNTRVVTEKWPISFVLVDNKPHLNDTGVKYFIGLANKFFLLTTNKDHPAFKYQKENDNLVILFYEDKIDFKDAFSILKSKYQVDRITIQSGGTLNETFLSENLIDYVNIVVAPVLVGGKSTASLIDGNDIYEVSQLSRLKALKLLECKVLEDSYIQLRYQVIK